MLNRTIAAMAPLQMARFDLEGILVTRFVNPRLADLLRELGV